MNPTPSASKTHADESAPAVAGTMPNRASGLPPSQRLNESSQRLGESGQRLDKFVDGAVDYDGPERRVSRRIPRSLEITVQPLNEQMDEVGLPYFAITRDISQGGLAFLSSQRANFDKAVISINEGIAPGIVCRICNSSVIHSSGSEEVHLTNVEFLFLHKARK